MSNPLQFSVDFGHRTSDKRPRRGEPLRILLLTDLGDSCRSRADMPVETRPMRLMDVDRFEDLLNDEHPGLSLPSGDLRFQEIEDFHPDHVVRAVPLFQTLKDLRSRLKTPSTFASAAQELRAMLNTVPEASPPDAKTSNEDDSATLSRLFGQPATDRPAQGGGSGPTSFLGALLHEAVAAHITADADPRADQYLAALDDAMAAQLRAVLHDPGFQALESAWRGLNFLVSQIETDEDLTLHVWNTSKSELVAALGPADGAPDRSVLHRRLVEDREGRPFTLIVTDFAFDSTTDDMRLLAALGAMAGRTNGLVLAPVTSQVIGADSWQALARSPESVDDADANWTALRTTPMADHIVALGPRFLLRAPYGKRTDPVDAFAFEELQPDGDATLLWGAPTLLASVLIAQSFRNDEWDARLNQTLGFDDLPLVPYEADGTQQIKPCAEVLIPDRSAEAILKAGPVPVLAIKNQNGVRLPWFQSIASTRRSDRLGPFTL